MSAIIQVSNISKQFRRRIPGEAKYGTLRDSIASAARNVGRGQAQKHDLFSALKDVSFDVQPGEVVGLIGRNGAGKSTLLKVLSRITPPTSGEITLHGRVGSLLEVGTGFHPELTGRENIYMNGAILGMKQNEIQRRFDEIVDFSGVENFIDTPVKHYSSGMKARLAFSVAAHLDPEILIIDEVLAVGDYEFQKKCLGAMKSVSQSGRTVIFVSHNMNIIRQLCNRGIYLRNGTVHTDSHDIDQVVSEYMTIESDAQTYWDARQETLAIKDQAFIPQYFHLSIQNEIIKRPIAGDEQVMINIGFDAQKTEKGLSAGYALFDNMGALLYWTYSTDDTNSAVSLVSGQNHIQSAFPAHILNDGEYRLVLIAGIQNDRPIYRMDTSPVMISVSIQGNKNRSGYWSTKRHSVIAPSIAWTSKQENKI